MDIDQWKSRSPWEEGGVFITGQDPMTAAKVAERIRQQGAVIRLAPPEEKKHLTISAGVNFRNSLEPMDELIHQTGTPLYQAKKAGQNRAVVSGSPG